MIGRVRPLRDLAHPQVSRIAHGRGMGRRPRSSPSTREACTWRRGPASRQGGCWDARRLSPVNTDESELTLFRAERRVREIQAKLHRWADHDPQRDLWSARCSETGTAGAGGGSGKPTGGNTGRAPRVDLTAAASPAHRRRRSATRPSVTCPCGTASSLPTTSARPPSGRRTSTSSRSPGDSSTCEPSVTRRLRSSRRPASMSPRRGASLNPGRPPQNRNDQTPSGLRAYPYRHRSVGHYTSGQTR